MNKEDNFKEKFKQALISTIKVISDEYRVETELKKNLSSKIGRASCRERV